MKILLVILFFMSCAYADMFIQLNGEMITGHDYNQHDGYSIKIPETKLADDNGNYIYKFKNGSLVPMTQIEKETNPNYVSKQDIKNKANARKDALERLKNCDPEDIPTGFLKDLCLQYKEIK